jgi:hypothetical protein
MIDISALELAEVLVALYNRATPVEMGWHHYEPADMTLEEAKNIIESHTPSKTMKMRDGTMVANYHTDIHFDYLKGRLMKIYFLPKVDGDTTTYDFLDVTGYDKNYGEFSAYNILKPLFEKVKNK